MPPLPDVAGVVFVRVKGTTSGANWNNVFHLQYTGTAPTTATLNSVCASVLTAWATNFGPLCQAGVALVGADAADLTNRQGAIGTNTNTTAGSRAGTAMTNQAACVVSWPINRRYRGGHPRTYLPAGVLADVTSNRLWSSTFITAVVNGATSFRTALNAISIGGTTFTMVSVQYYDQKVLLSNPVPWPIQIPKVHGRVDTQRSRLGREVG